MESLNSGIVADYNDLADRKMPWREARRRVDKSTWKYMKGPAAAFSFPS